MHPFYTMVGLKNSEKVLDALGGAGKIEKAPDFPHENHYLKSRFDLKLCRNVSEVFTTKYHPLPTIFRFSKGGGTWWRWGTW